MKKQHHRPRGRERWTIFALALCGWLSTTVQACTIFVLTDTNRALFCNNEDWSDPKTMIWFVPSGPDHYGCACVGFDDGLIQGGLNTEGFAFDWVAGSSEPWEPDPNLPVSFGNRQLLETCATVEEAITFFKTHRELAFYWARILVADRTGASAIIGAKAGKLQVERATRSRGFGYGERKLDLAGALRASTPTLANGARILQASLHKGTYATKYSNIFDLKSGDIFLFPVPEREDQVNLNLAAELKKGPHYYDMPQIRSQLAQAPAPLLPSMGRLLLDKYKTIPDKEPQVTAHVRAMWRDVLDGTMRAADYTAEGWKLESAKAEVLQPGLKSFGGFVSVALVDRGREADKQTYRYRLEFERDTLLLQYLFDEQGKLAATRIEDLK